jgi:hypothetical protein
LLGSSLVIGEQAVKVDLTGSDTFAEWRRAVKLAMTRPSKRVGW